MSGYRSCSAGCMQQRLNYISKRSASGKRSLRRTTFFLSRHHTRRQLTIVDMYGTHTREASRPIRCCISNKRPVCLSDLGMNIEPGVRPWLTYLCNTTFELPDSVNDRMGDCEHENCGSSYYLGRSGLDGKWSRMCISSSRRLVIDLVGHMTLTKLPNRNRSE